MQARFLLLLIFTSCTITAKAQYIKLQSDTLKPRMLLKRSPLLEMKKTDTLTKASVYRHPKYRMPVVVPDTTSVAQIPVQQPDTLFKRRMPVKMLNGDPLLINPAQLKNPGNSTTTPPNRQ